jgi:hypothetical protein
MIGKNLNDPVYADLAIGDDIDLTDPEGYRRNIENADFKHIRKQVTRVTYKEETSREVIGYLGLIPLFGNVTRRYVTFYNGSNAVLREEQTGNGQDPPREYIVNYIYDDHWNETGSGTVSGSGTIPLPEPDLAALAAPQAAKTLTENLKDPDAPDSWDGTYTMTLSVTVPGQGAQNKNRANIVVVYDSSNSMFEPDYYYEDPNGSYGTLYG